MKKYLSILCFALFCFACEDNYIDTGISNGKHDCSMYDYLCLDSYNWDSTRLIIDRAELKYMFDGTKTEFADITFFGPTNHSIRSWMIANNYGCVSDIPVNICKEYMEKYIYKDKKMMRTDFLFEVKGTSDGGSKIVKLDGNEIRVFRRSTDWGSIADGGAEELYVQSYAYGTTIRIASVDIETLTGVVHSLSYTHIFGNF